MGDRAALRTLRHHGYLKLITSHGSLGSREGHRGSIFIDLAYDFGKEISHMSSGGRKHIRGLLLQLT